jgi:hypothetical protein
MVKFAGEVQIKFMVIPRKDMAFVLLGENLPEAFGVEDLERHLGQVSR